MSVLKAEPVHPDIAAARELIQFRARPGAYLVALLLFAAAWLLYGQGYRVLREAINAPDILNALMIAWTAVSGLWVTDRYADFVASLHRAPARPSPWVLVLGLTACLCALNWLMWLVMPQAYQGAMARWVGASTAVLIAQATLIGTFLIPTHRHARMAPLDGSWQLLGGTATRIHPIERRLTLLTDQGPLELDFGSLEHKECSFLHEGAFLQVVTLKESGQAPNRIIRVLRPGAEHLPWFLQP